MISVDTNLLVQLITNETVEQADRVEALIKSTPVFIPLTVVLELEWVLRSRMGFRRPEVHDALTALACVPTVNLEHSGRVLQALGWAGAGLDFADALHLASSADCESLASFDRKLAKRAQRLGALPTVIEP